MMTNEHLLTGFRVLDLTRALAGPTCTRMFAELGADVIKVEAAPDGDMVRTMSKIRNERSLYLIQQNLNKKSLCLDFRRPEGMALIRELVPHCDVVVENYRPGVMAKMGLAYDDLRELRDDIILCSISALGQTGPLSGKPGYDYIAQAYSGVTSMIGESDDAPYIPLIAVGDVSTGVTAAFGIAAALLNRSRTGEGQHLDIALLDCYYHYHEVNVHQYSGSNGEIKPMRCGRHLTYVCPAGVFKATNGHIILIAFLHHWADLCTAMGRPELVEDEAFATDPARLERVSEVVALIEAWLATFPDVDSAIELLESHGIPCAPILTVEETVTHPHFVARGTVRTIKDPIAGEFQIPGMPVKTSGYPADNDYLAPLLGEHNGEILKGILGKSDADVEALTKVGVLHAGDV
ncbi:MAG: CoA transferase [Proteobacteria bacterium]|nr:CoA transferase [Pseudomonadota bacterium]MCZ6892744.1 CoA transferase [Gammaproteobacteria bacterium]